jgi:hypothetical protein
VTATNDTLSETEVSVTWSAPGSGTVLSYDVQMIQNNTVVNTVTVSSAQTTTTLTNLSPGSTFYTAVKANMAGTGPTPAPNTNLTFGHTPFGAVNADSVNDVTWNVWKPAGIDGAVMTDNFSLIWGFYWNPDFSAVFSGVPSTTDKAEWVFNSWQIDDFFNNMYQDDITGMWSNGTNKLAVTTARGNVWLWDYIPSVATTSEVLASRRIGQGSTGQSTFSTDWQNLSPCYDATTNKFYVANPARNRVLVFNGWPSAIDTNATYVLGQSDFTTYTANSGGRSATSLSGPSAVSCHDGIVAVADYNNHRVLVWTTAITGNNQAADVIFGQSDATSGAANGAGGISAGGLNLPSGVLVVPKAGGGHALIVAEYGHDGGNNRITEWDTIPSSNGTTQYGGDFTRVYGQPNETTTTANTNGRSLSSIGCARHLTHEMNASGSPKSDVFWATDGCYWKGSANNGRMLKYTRGTATASDFWGAADGASYSDGYGYDTNREFFWNVNMTSIFACMGSDGTFNYSNSHWRTAPSNGNVTRSLSEANRCSAISGGGYTWVSRAYRISNVDYASIWGMNVSTVGDLPSSLSSPSYILGRKLENGSDNSAVPDTWEYKIQYSKDLRVNGNYLLSRDTHRIVGWDISTLSSHKAISFAIGQPNVTSNAANTGGLSASTLSSPLSMFVSGTKLIVADSGNNRVLIWNTVPTTTGTAADVVLGQANGTSNGTGTGLGNMNRPTGAVVINNRLLVADHANYRILVWDSIPTSTGTSADRAIDLRNYKYQLPVWYSQGAVRPQSLLTYGGRAYVEQYGRTLVLPDIFGQ